MKNKSNARTRQLLIYILLLAAAVGCMIWLRHRSAVIPSPSEGEVQDTIHAAIVYGPTSYRVLISEEGDDSITGINYHLLKQLEDELKVKIQLHPVIDRDEALAKVRSSQYDILASVPADNYLKQEFLTSGDVYLDRLVLLQNTDTAAGAPKVRSALDLDGDTVHVETGSAAKRRLENLSREIGGTIHVAEEQELSEEYIAIKVATGVWKYAVVNEKTAEEMKARYPLLDFSTPVSFTQFQVWVLPEGKDSLLQQVNSFLKTHAAASR
ncbi:MAG: transporter substrate-binding domain-containing protein [Muribaculaceae bacterium]|nr:transporter substrate-binding domain-containing protein [Muribaculaceae bacterium]